MPITFDMLADFARHSAVLLTYALTIIFAWWIVEKLISRS